MKSSLWSVGAIAEKFDLPTNVLRHWESVGLLAPERDSAGRRRYSRDDAARVAVIQRSKAAGMSLDQIAVLINGEARDRHVVLEAHLTDLDERMEEMRLSRAMTEHAMSCKAHDVTTCPNFRTFFDDLMTGL